MIQPGNRREHNRSQAAFTLAELVVSIGLMSLLVSMLFAILTSAQDTVIETRRDSDIQENARVALAFVKDELLNAKPPRNDRNRDLYDDGYMFVIRNNPDGISGNDELWFTTGSGLDSKGRSIRKNVRYFVAEDEAIGLNVLKRQEFKDLFADYLSPPEPIEESGDSEEEEKDTVTICVYIERFDVEYLNFEEEPESIATIPYKYIPPLGDDESYDINFREPDVWDECGMSPNQTSPPAIRITMVVRDSRGRQNHFTQKVFWVPFSTFNPSIEEPPPPEEDDD